MIVSMSMGRREVGKGEGKGEKGCHVIEEGREDKPGL
jgi:hypothetical protein